MPRAKLSEDADRTEVLESIIEHLPTGVAVFEIDGKPVIFNRAFREIYDIPEGVFNSTDFSVVSQFEI